jgi:type I restriction enzyme S subunit
MNADILLKHFERISEAPDAVTRLRRFILDLAMCGKLVEQDPNDEPTAELLKRIQAGKIKKATLLSPVAPNELPFDLPLGWGLARFGDVFSLEYGDNLTAEKRSNTGEFPVYGSNGVVGSHFECFVNSPCIVVGRKGSAGALNLSLTSGCCVTDVAYYCIPPNGLDMAFSFKLFHTIGLDSLGKGVKPGLSRNEAYVLPIAIPPLAEQHRIVAKVDELMALCDQLQAAQNEREAQRDRLVAASLHRIGTAPATADEAETGSEKATPLPEAARFHLAHLPRLTTRPEHVKQLRQTILNLAVRGRLVPQDSNDEPALELLKRIQTEKAALMLQKRIQRNAEVEYSVSLDEPHAPKEWCWVYVSDVALIQGGKRLPAGATFTKEKTPHIYIRVTDMKAGSIRTDNPQYLAPEVQKIISKYTINKEDLYITIAGTIGQVGRVPATLDGQNLTENAAKIVFREIDADFFAMALSAEGVQLQFQDKTKQMAQPKLALKRIAGARFPLPPLAEQHRIVAKVDELMALCDQLEAQITTTQTDSRRLLEAVLHEALAA